MLVAFVILQQWLRVAVAQQGLGQPSPSRGLIRLAGDERLPQQEEQQGGDSIMHACTRLEWEGWGEVGRHIMPPLPPTHLPPPQQQLPPPPPPAPTPTHLELRIQQVEVGAQGGVVQPAHVLAEKRLRLAALQGGVAAAALQTSRRVGGQQ